MKEHYRQGDLLFIKTDEKPRGKVSKTGIVALGEVTGHKHRVQGGLVYTPVKRPNWGAFIVAPKGVVVTHPEHKPITLPEGNYKITHQREYQPKRIRYVSD